MESVDYNRWRMKLHENQAFLRLHCMPSPIAPRASKNSLFLLLTALFNRRSKVNFAITITTLENIAPVFQPMRSKTKPNLSALFFPVFAQVTGDC